MVHGKAYCVVVSGAGYELLFIPVTDYIFEPTCANARWTLMHRFLSVCPDHRGVVGFLVCPNYHLLATIWFCWLPRACWLSVCPRSHGSGSKVKWVKPSLQVMSLAGGLMSTSSCIFSPHEWCLAGHEFMNSSLLHYSNTRTIASTVNTMA